MAKCKWWNEKYFAKCIEGKCPRNADENCNIIPKRRPNTRMARDTQKRFLGKTNAAYFNGSGGITVESQDGRGILIDIDSYEKIKDMYWAIRKGVNTYYAYSRPRKNGYKTIFMHRLIIKAKNGYDVDHINGNGLDNRIENLRTCTRSQNCMNMTKYKGKSKYKGVSMHRGKWMAYITKDRKMFYLGVFDSEECAALAYNNAAKANFGEFAKLNIIDRKYMEVKK